MTPPTVIFTAFEPSGDAHAAPVISALRARAPKLGIIAWGGPQMEAAGATVIETTADDGAMGLGAIAKAGVVRRTAKAVKAWVRKHGASVHVPVDSPAANFPICKTLRKLGLKTVHLVAPQLWAWGSWRAGKVRRRTDLLLCLLPFEEEWFGDRNIPARFVGHPAINRELDEAVIKQAMLGLPSGAPRLLLLPGSRSQEVRANLKLLLNTFMELKDRHSGMAGLIVAANPGIAAMVRKRLKVFPMGLHMSTGNLDPAIAWCDLAVSVSGTVTLHIARQRKAMIGVYKTGLVSWMVSKVVLRTPLRLLPNIIAGEEICPEFVPHVGGAMPIVRQATRFLQDSKNAAGQRDALAMICQRFAGRDFAAESAAAVVEMVKKTIVEKRDA